VAAGKHPIQMTASAAVDPSAIIGVFVGADDIST
jgi:hypothetical protein